MGRKYNSYSFVACIFVQDIYVKEGA